ncbi:MAG: hypothetical protein K0S32_47 [Bacteroidetes bacterium]|jgi:hypothetical protein|nr:hypothetical protein [Bacteroidota bacterium]
MKKLPLFILLSLLSIMAYSQTTTTGVITSVKGKTFVLKLDSATTIPNKGDSCYAYKDISGSKNPFGIKISSGWMGVAKTVVTACDKNKMAVLIVKETSNIVINGKKTEHFVVGKKFKMEWGEKK